MSEKKCCRCKNPKPLSEFHKDRSKPDGHSLTCKECIKKCHRIISLKEKFPPGELACVTCGELKPSSEFHQNLKTKTGLNKSCKTCKSISNREYRNRNEKLCEHINYSFKQMFGSIYSVCDDCGDVLA